MMNMPELSDDGGKQIIADTLRMYVGRGRRFSWEDLATATGDDERKLRSYVDRDPAAMPVTVFMRVFAVLPPEAFGRVCGKMGFCAPPPIERNDDASVRRALAAASRLVANGNEYLEDGVLSPSERANLADEAVALIPALRQVAEGKG